MHPRNPSERRRDPRLEHNIPLKISCEDLELVTETKNISCSGAYCRVNKYIEPMTKLKIHLLLPVKVNNKVVTRKISCQGIVVRSESVPTQGGFNTAVFFNDIQPKDSRSISDFVETMLDHKNATAV